MKSFFLQDWQAFLRYGDHPGEGPVNVYLAGLIWASQACFVPMVARNPALSARRSLCIDLFGTGFSDAPQAFNYTLEDHAATVAVLLDELRLRQSQVIGYSIGGAVAITLAAIRPDLVSALVLMEANLDPLGPGEGLVSSEIADQTEAEFSARGFQTLVDSFRQAGIEGNEASATTAGILQAAAPHAVYRSAVALVRGTRPTMRQRLLQLEIPRAFIVGVRSLPQPKWESLPDHGIRMLQVADAGHSMVWENPGGVAEAIANAFAS